MVTGSPASAAPCASRRPHASSTHTSAAADRAGVNREALAAKYDSRSPWKSRWSWLRLVNIARSNTMPSTRPSASAWLDTSIVSAVTPRSRITASRACTSGASGVVRTAGSSSSPIRARTVPIRPVVCPPAHNAASSRKLVVVLPLVPVIPVVASASAGSPYTQADTSPSTPRGSPTTRTGASTPASARIASPSGSVRIAAAPADAACVPNRAPCVVNPGSAAYRSPACTWRESRVTPVIRSGGPAGSPSRARRSAPARRTPVGRIVTPAHHSVGMTGDFVPDGAIFSSCSA